ncbi:hypothetical protein [Paenibacillus sanguinis]|uniref:hypothetical protein n=1 Tax=Paenibacillus sanguinis TaxID=225906 RepID=UPI00035D3D63|nr:hypothetical protein [Paenibacillus sanguinis]
MLTRGRNTPEFAGGRLIVVPVQAGAKIFDGALVALNADGFAIPGTLAPDLTAAGRAEEEADNTNGADGELTVRISRGVFVYSNSSTAPITQKDVLKDCYIEDDETVSATATDTSIAGKVLGFEGSEVIVEIL